MKTTFSTLKPERKEDFVELCLSFYGECNGSPQLPCQLEVVLNIFECTRMS